MKTYRLLDCGNQKKVEQFGDFKLIRPCPQALWDNKKSSAWEEVDSEFVREEKEKGKWRPRKLTGEHKRKHIGMGIPDEWVIESEDSLKWVIQPNEFGNVGVFTEHWVYQNEISQLFSDEGPILNLFTYSGSNCLSLIKKGFKVTAVDSSKNAMDTFTRNLALNNLSRNGIRLVLEDASKFVQREIRRGSSYNSIMVDAPSFGRGTKGEVFNIEENFVPLLKSCHELLTKNGKMIITLHSPRFTPVSLEVLCEQIFHPMSVKVKEIVQLCESGVRLPSGFIVLVNI